MNEKEAKVMEIFNLYKMLTKENKKLAWDYIDQLLAEQERETK